MNSNSKSPDFVKYRESVGHDIESPLNVLFARYSDAVKSLVDLARKGCGGSHPAAMVLLSLQNGADFRVDLEDVCCRLDGDYLLSVLVAMQGRAILMKRPQEVIEGGFEFFRKLELDWGLIERTETQ